MIGKDDAVLAISYSGESAELTSILPHIKRFNIPLIGMAKSQTSSLGRYSDVFIPVRVEKEACPLDAAPTSSTTLTLALGDALAMCLMHMRDFQKEDFASFHPGGSLGKRLFVKVKDLMRTEDLPVINEQASLKEAITVMSEGRLGNVLLVNTEGKLTALLSDGDLRRALMDESFSITKAAIEYATKEPKTLQKKGMLASDALALIDSYRIQMIVIVDKDDKPIGVLHIHDLVEAGIK